MTDLTNETNLPPLLNVRYESQLPSLLNSSRELPLRIGRGCEIDNNSSPCDSDLALGAQASLLPGCNSARVGDEIFHELQILIHHDEARKVKTHNSFRRSVAPANRIYRKVKIVEVNKLTRSRFETVALPIAITIAVWPLTEKSVLGLC